MNNLYFLIIIGVSAIVLIASIVVYQYQFAYGHHSIGDYQPENPHNPSNYDFTFDDFTHCSEVQDAHESQYIFNLCKELGWDWIDGHWDNPYLDKEQGNTKDDDTYLDEDTTENVITPPDSGDGTDNVRNRYFSIKVPDSWAYTETSNTPEAVSTGFGPENSIQLTPNEFSDILASRDFEKIRQERIPYAQFIQDTNYPKNAALESYVKSQINYYGIENITSQEYTTVGNEKAVRIYANGSARFGDDNIALYLVMNDKLPYAILYIATPINYEKYLSEFEEMVKSFRFTDSPSSEIENMSENVSATSTATNFSGANLSEVELYTNSTGGDSNYSEELYDECVNVAGKSMCDFLFKR